MTPQSLMLLFAGAVLVGLVAVVVDRLNFPQKRFNPKTVRPIDGQSRDRTGAHITEFEPHTAPIAADTTTKAEQEQHDS